MLNGLVAQTADGTGGGGLFASPLFPILLIFAVMYFLIIRPQSKQQKQHQAFLSQLKKGDEVVLQSGLFGKVHAVGQADVTIELAPNVRVRALKSAVTGPAKAAEAKPGDAKSDEKPEDKK